MKQVKGWWVPDYDNNMDVNISEPEFCGRLTYQFYLFKEAFRYIKRFHTAVDAGAHIGLLTHVMSQCFKWVIAFEPVAEHFRCLEKNVGPNEHCGVVLKNAALGSSVGVVDMNIKPPWSLKARVRSPSQRGVIGIGCAPVTTLDTETTEIDFLKIDCEGYELFVLQGGEGIIRRCKPTIVIEQKHGNTLHYNLRNMEAVVLLKSWGAELFWQRHDDYCLGWMR